MSDMDKLEKLQELGKSYAEGMFQEFSENPGYKGPNFTWDEFPEMVARMARVSAFQYFPETEKLTQEDEDVAAQAARTTATKLVKQLEEEEN